MGWASGRGRGVAPRSTKGFKSEARLLSMLFSFLSFARLPWSWLVPRWPWREECCCRPDPQDGLCLLCHWHAPPCSAQGMLQKTLCMLRLYVQLDLSDDVINDFVLGHELATPSEQEGSVGWFVGADTANFLWGTHVFPRAGYGPFLARLSP